MIRVVVITQEDSFTIPRNIERVAALPGVNLTKICVVSASGSVVNRKRMFLDGFGLLQAARMGTVLYRAKLLDCFDRATGYRLLSRKRSVFAVAARRAIPCLVLADVNERSSVKLLELEAPDLILSFSAPCVFKPELLNVPKLGCINLHCSLLPKYAGLLPSFWVLFHNERVAGATVHYMDDKIDNGAILGQVQVPVESGTSMFKLIERTKEVGGALVCQILKEALCGALPPARPNQTEKGNYFSWPTVEQMREFRSRGGRLI